VAVDTELLEREHGTAKQSMAALAANRLGPAWLNGVKAWFGLPWQRRLGRAALRVRAIRRRETEFGAFSDDDLKKKSRQLFGLARGQMPLERLLPEAFGLLSVAIARELGIRPFDVQLAAAVVLHEGALAEVATGEGKTLIAMFPTYLNALSGHGVHTMTVNDYLARRDAEWTGAVFRRLGLTVGTLQAQMSELDRRQAYQCDITYGTSGEFGFDFLRDRVKLKEAEKEAKTLYRLWKGEGQPSQPMTDGPVQRGHNFALVDEADSILIDEARTPLIISAPTRLAKPEEQVIYRWADSVGRVCQLGIDFRYDRKTGQVQLTEPGKKLARWSSPPCGPHSHATDKLHKHLERAIQAHHRYRLDQHYILREGKVVIVDEYTGRIQPDRHWQDGLHQAVEAKEGIPITVPCDPLAQVTFQNYLRNYKKLAGMTGTAAQNSWEFLRVYWLWVVCIPTNRPVIREQLPDWVFPSQDAKFDAVIDEVVELQRLGRPVLIGTRSVEKSEEISRRLHEMRIDHHVLNAKHQELESQIVAQAGQPGQVTIATNMAGRGTDIRLGPGVAALGGLHIIGTERHDARRIDRQLAGRAGRQGDPGSCQFYLALDDELLEGLGHSRQAFLLRRGLRHNLVNWQRYQPLFLVAQKRRERKHRKERIDLMYYEKSRRETLQTLGADPYVD
jgi:preprotein translocase subunit SecA